MSLSELLHLLDHVFDLTDKRVVIWVMYLAGLVYHTDYILGLVSGPLSKAVDLLGYVG